MQADRDAMPLRGRGHHNNVVSLADETRAPPLLSARNSSARDNLPTPRPNKLEES